MQLWHLLFALAIICTSIISCSGGKGKNKHIESAAEVEVPKNYIINPDDCLSISILKGEGEIIGLNDEDFVAVLAFLNSGEYNKERNDSGIKFKMVSPNYTFLVEFRDGKKEMVQYWVEPLLILYEAKWYNPISVINIEDTLAKYSK